MNVRPISALTTLGAPTHADEADGQAQLNFGPAENSNRAEATRRDAASLQSLLKNRFAGEADAIAADPAAKPATPSAPSHFRSRLLKSVLGLALIATAGWMPLERLFQVSSVEAVVNARIITLRAPIAGVVEAGAGLLQVGNPVPAGGLLVAVSDPRSDHGAANAAIDHLQQVRDDRRTLIARMDSLKAMRTTLTTRLDAFHDNRRMLVSAQLREAAARVASAAAVEARAQSVLERQAALKGKKVSSQAAIDDATRDLDVAKAGREEALARLAALTVEADALSKGDFFGDDYNDEPQSAQQLDVITQSIAALAGEIAAQDQRIAGAEAALRREQDRLALASKARLEAPVGGRVWEILTAPGEQVVAGQELVRLLNCSEALVTAVVSETVYNGLSLGMPATFAPSDGGAARPGKVVQLSGVASASSNFAIVPSALTKESYRVAVAVEGGSPDGSCAVGSTGRVVFRPAE